MILVSQVRQVPVRHCPMAVGVHGAAAEKQPTSVLHPTAAQAFLSQAVKQATAIEAGT